MIKNRIANIEVSNKPLIFTKKVNDKSKIIPLNLNNNTLGERRHFPPASKEWLNSVYAYNSNYIKSLPVADKNLMRLIQSYFNFFKKDESKSKRLRIRFRRLLVSKIFVGKAELKHTSSKVIITLYVYNKQKEMLANKIKNLEKKLFAYPEDQNKLKNLSFKDKFKLIDRQKSYIMQQVENEKLLILNSFKVKGSFNIHNVRLYNEFTKNLLEKELIAMTYYKLLLDFNKLKFEDAYLLRLSNLLSKIYNKDVEFNIVSLKYLYLNSDILSQAIALKLKNRDNRLLKVLKSSLSMVKLPLRNKVTETIPNRSEEYLMNTIKNLNIFSTFNPSVQTQGDGPGSSLLHFSLSSKFSLDSDEVREKTKKKSLDKEKQNNKTLLNTSDSLNKLLLGIFPNGQGLPLFYLPSNLKEEASSKVAGIGKGPESEQTVERFLFNNLKHKAIGGVRLEAKGRLTRRFTASRSVFKVKWKGSLKNIDSSYKGLSTVMLRGHAKSNVQYTNINSKNRNGSFGIKGWVSSK